MLSVTDGALERLARMLDDLGAEEYVVVRCIIDGQSLALVPANEEPGDVIFRHAERVVLVVAQDLSEALDGREFDVDPTTEEDGLTLR